MADLEALAGEVLGRPVPSVSRLTQIEVTRLIDHTVALTRPDGTVLCDHLAGLEREMLDRGIPVSRHFIPWQYRSRNWAYFDVILDRDRIRERLRLPGHVEDRDHWGTHAGQEWGFYCTLDEDALVGHHPRVRDVGWDKRTYA